MKIRITELSPQTDPSPRVVDGKARSYHSYRDPELLGVALPCPRTS